MPELMLADTYPAGARALVAKWDAPRMTRALVEVEVLEWAPSGCFVLLRTRSGEEGWQEPPMVEERLPGVGVIGAAAHPAEAAVKDFALTLLAADRVARARGEQFGLCDAVSNDGDPYPSKYLSEVMAKARDIAAGLGAGLTPAVHPRWSTQTQWATRFNPETHKK